MLLALMQSHQSSSCTHMSPQASLQIHKASSQALSYPDLAQQPQIPKPMHALAHSAAPERQNLLQPQSHDVDTCTPQQEIMTHPHTGAVGLKGNTRQSAALLLTEDQESGSPYPTEDPKTNHPFSASACTYAPAACLPASSLQSSASNPVPNLTYPGPKGASAAPTMSMQQTSDVPLSDGSLLQQPQDTRTAFQWLQQPLQDPFENPSRRDAVLLTSEPPHGCLQPFCADLKAEPHAKMTDSTLTHPDPSSLATIVYKPDTSSVSAVPAPLATNLYMAGSYQPPTLSGHQMPEARQGSACAKEADMTLPLCHSSISADSRQSCSPGLTRKRTRNEQVAADEQEEAINDSRKARNREAARRTRAKKMATIASLSLQVQLLTSTNQHLSLQLHQASHQTFLQLPERTINTCGEVQVHMMRQERDMLRRILINHAQQMAETGDVSDNICSVARDLLQFLMQEQPADLQQLLHNPNVTTDDALFSL